MTDVTLQDEPDEYDAFATPAEITAYYHAKHGSDALREWLRMRLDNSKRLTREDLEDDADELEGIDLSEAATIVREAAQQARSETDMFFCPYMVEPYISSKHNQHNIAAWLRSVRLQRERKKRLRLTIDQG